MLKPTTVDELNVNAVDGESDGEHTREVTLIGVRVGVSFGSCDVSLHSVLTVSQGVLKSN